MFDFLKIPQHVAISYFRRLETSYFENPYHNSKHGADVLASMLFLVRGLDRFLSLLEKLACFIAAAAHDAGHPGYNNAFLITINSPESITYNDKSILENVHNAVLFNILSDPSSNILRNLSVEDYRQVRKTTIELILATDLGAHFDLIGQARALLSAAENGGPPIGMDDPKDRLMRMKLAIKCADVGHAVKSWELHDMWSGKITEEFYLQGDLETRLGLHAPSFMQRSNHLTEYPKGQKV